MFIKRVFFILLFLGVFLDLFAKAKIEEKISALVEPQSRLTHKKLINILFQDRDNFYDESGNIDIIKIVRTLKENGLLKIFHDEPVKIKASFKFEANPVFMIKVISDALIKLGYQYILISDLEKKEKTTEWAIEYKSQHVIDPVTLFEELLKYNVSIDNVSRDENEWKYELSTEKPTLFEAIKISEDENLTKHNDPRGEFWFDIEENATLAYIKSSYPDLWHPYIICYNYELKILKIYKREKSTRSLKMVLPKGTKYIKLTDIFTPENLKHGIEIKIEGTE